jgi:hypothetical protein
MEGEAAVTAKTEKEPEIVRRAPANLDDTTASIDVEKLADKVYHLMLEEIRLTRVRGVSKIDWRSAKP